MRWKFPKEPTVVKLPKMSNRRTCALLEMSQSTLQMRLLGCIVLEHSTAS